MKTLGLLFIIAVVVEAIIDYFEWAFDFIEDERIKKLAKQGTALVLAEIFSFQLGALILTPFIETFGGSVKPWFDMAVAGIFCSRGANYLSDIVRLLISIGSMARAIMTGVDDQLVNMFDFVVDEEDDDESADESEES